MPVTIYTRCIFITFMSMLKKTSAETFGCYFAGFFFTDRCKVSARIRIRLPSNSASDLDSISFKVQLADSDVGFF